MRFVKYYSPLIISLALLFIIVSIIFLGIIDFTGGKLVYTLDDAYIYLATSKNLVLHNVWGITQNEFSGSVTSSVWTVMLAVSFFFFGVSDCIPFILNLLFASLLMYVIFNYYKKHTVSNFYTGIVLITIILFIPLSVFIFSGMEHLLHAILTILFLKYSAQSLSQDSVDNKITSNEKLLLVTSFFLAGIRYEGVILLGIVSVLYFVRKRYWFAIMLFATGIIIPFAFGLYSISHGGNIFPNSVLLKSSLFGGDTQTVYASLNISEYLSLSKKIILLFLISAYLFYLQIKLKKNFWSEIPLMLFILISVILIQKTGISTAYFRYDAYLTIAAIAVNAFALYDYCKRKFNIEINISLFKKSKIALIIFIIYSICLIYKSFNFEKTTISVKNIYEQQYQMARFVSKYYQGKAVGLNDIGAVNYYSEINCLDLMGLADNDILKLRMSNSFDSESMNKIVEDKKIDIVIIYEEWFQKNGDIPEGWTKAGQWKIKDNYICGSDSVSFYAVTPEESERLMANLNSFSKELPEDVIQSGSYLTGK